MVIFLIGFMGCGKSTMGCSVAKRLDYGFIDMDHDIEERTGMSVAEIFERHGEAFFREQEQAAIERYTEMSNTVVATGGGAPCTGDNMERLNRAGITVYLKMSPEKIAVRLSSLGRDKRPLLRGKNDAEILAYIRERLPQREPFYTQAALVINAEGVNNEYIAEHIAAFIEHQTKQNSFNANLTKSK